MGTKSDEVAGSALGPLHGARTASLLRSTLRRKPGDRPAHAIRYR
jgi:hypothetical protein